MGLRWLAIQHCACSTRTLHTSPRGRSRRADSAPPDRDLKSMFGREVHGHHPCMDDSPPFLTGATGFVGMELLARYLERTNRTIYALVRGSDDADAQARLDATVARMLPNPGSYHGRAVAVCGDVMKPGMGLAPRDRAELAEQAGEIVHAAASVSFALPLPESRAINVGGTR